MKKFFISLFAIAALLSSCGKETAQKENSPRTDIETPQLADMVEVHFTATTDLTKAALDGLNVSFSPGDKIAIFKNGNKYQFTTTSGGANATFGGSISAEDLAAEGDFYALFPYSDGAGISEGTITGVTLSKYSTRTVGSFAPQQAIFVAKSSTQDLVFMSAVALLKVTVPEGIDDLADIAVFNRISGLTGAITGTFNVTPGDDAPVVVVTAGNGDPHTAGLNGGTFQAGTYYIPVLPSTLTQGFDMRLVFNKSGDAFNGRLAIGSEITFEAGKVYNLGTIKRQRYFVIDGFEKETVGVKSTKWTGNDAYVRANPFSVAENNSAKVLEMDMHQRALGSSTSGYLQYTIPIASTSFKQYFSSLSVKVYYDGTYGTKHDYCPHLLWNKSGTATRPAKVNDADITDDESFYAAMRDGKWNTFTWNASQFDSTNLTSLTSLQIRFFVDWDNNSLTTGQGYGLYACIDELTFHF